MAVERARLAVAHTGYIAHSLITWQGPDHQRRANAKAQGALRRPPKGLLFSFNHVPIRFSYDLLWLGMWGTGFALGVLWKLEDAIARRERARTCTVGAFNQRDGTRQKTMSSHGLSPEEVVEATERFQREALLLARFTHPNLPRIYEQFSEGTRWYLVMDFIEGETLEARLGRIAGGCLPVPEVLQLGIQLATVLVYLHTRHPPIIFRDLKPSNLMLTPDGRLYLIDFGIARFFKPGQSKDTTPFGSSGYAAPEQYGKAQTTPQADIYSLGATLHQLLSGTDPSQTPFVFAPLRLADSAGLEALILQMVETDKKKRPPSMEVIKQELQRLAAHRELATTLGLSARARKAGASAALSLPGPSLRIPLKRRLPWPSLQGIVVAAVFVCLVALVPLTIPFVSSIFSGGGSAVAVAPSPTPLPTPTDNPTPTDTPTPSPTPVPFPAGKAAYLIDAGPGQALYHANSTTRLPIASVTKIMTAILAIEQGGDLASNVAPITQAELAEVPDGCTTAGLVVGDENMSILHLLYGLMLQSGCDAAIVLAHAIAGTTAQFVAMMNAKVHILDLRNTHFTSPYGLEPTNYSTVADLVKLAQYAMKNQTFAGIVGTTQHIVPAQTNRHLYTWRNTNELLSGGLYAYSGANGVKTGTSAEAEYCLVFSATRNRRLLIGAELGVPTSDLLYRDAIQLLTLGFSRSDSRFPKLTQQWTSHSRRLISASFGHTARVSRPVSPPPSATSPQAYALASELSAKFAPVASAFWCPYPALANPRSREPGDRRCRWVPSGRNGEARAWCSLAHLRQCMGAIETMRGIA